MVEMMKDRWNGEVEGLVRRVQTTDWSEVRERWERRIGNVFSKLQETDTAKELENKIQEDVVGTGEDLKKIAQAPASTRVPRLLELK
jgi:Altered inheritance of mitochondria 5